MIHRDRLATIWKLAWPMILGMLSTNLLMLVDRFMIGRLGDSAVAAVGQGYFLNNFAIALLLGLTTSVQALTARYAGQERKGQEAAALNGGIYISVLIGVPLAVIGFFAAPYLFPYLSADPEVIQRGVPYVRALLIGSTAVGIVLSFQGFWNGLGQPLHYMRVLIMMQILNVGLNYLLIFGKLGLPALGVTGAGIASAGAFFFAVAIFFWMAFRGVRDKGFLKSPPSAALLKSVLKLSIPSSIQHTSFSAGYLLFLAMVARGGTADTAAASVLLMIMQVAILPAIGLGSATATLVGQSLGRDEPESANRWAWDTAKLGAILMIALCLPMVLIPEIILKGFLTNPETIALARFPLQITCVMVGLYSINFVMMYALLGAGAAKRVMLTSILCQWGVFLPAVWLVGPFLGHGLLEIWFVQLGYGLLACLAYSIQWARGAWRTIVL